MKFYRLIENAVKYYRKVENQSEMLIKLEMVRDTAKDCSDH